MSEARLVALYPYPTDIEQFNRDYESHMKLLHKSLQLPEDVQPYSIIRFMETPLGKPPYYQMFVFNFPSLEAMQQGMASPAMLVLAEDANRISSGGPPIFMIGS